MATAVRIIFKIRILCMLLLIPLLVISCGDASKKESSDFTTTTVTTDDGKTIIDKFDLGPGESRDITIEADEMIWVGFEADISYEKAQEYFPENVIKLEQEGASTYIASTNGGATVFKPVDGKIEVVVTSSANETFPIKVYTRPQK